MAGYIMLVLLYALFQCAGACNLAPPWNKTFEYPEARRDETVVDDYFGTKIADPYRWLKDPDSAETKAFIEAENHITRPFLDSCPVKKDINSRLTEIWNYPRYSTPFRSGHRVMYVQNSLNGKARVFLDPNKLSTNGTIALTGGSFAEDRSAFAYGLSANGSDFITIHRYPEQTDNTDVNRDQKLCYHRLNTPQEQDVVVVEFPKEPLWGIYAEVSDCGRYLLVYTALSTRDNLLFFADLSISSLVRPLPLTQIVHKFEADYQYVTNEGSICIFRSNKNAPNYRLIKIDLNNPSEENWGTLIPEHPSDVLDWAAAVDNDKLVIHYIRDVKSVLQLHSMKTGDMIQNFHLDIGSIVDFSGKKKFSEIFYKFNSFLTPGIIYRVDFKKKPYEPTVLREVKINGFNATQYESKQVFYSSKDGTRVPMFIVSKKDLPHDGSRPALLYGYGGFNIIILPTFSISRLVFMQDFDGTVAIPNIRGGGEYGERWYNAGRLLNKQNVFDDFIAAGEYLVRERITRPDLLTMQGGSNGGLLVAACANQRPDLFGAAVVQVGVLDMLRFQKFTIGHGWVSDYGSSDNKTQFEYLLKYSPLHNIQPPDNVSRAEYPATLVLTADHDDRVVPMHSLKYIATLQHAVRNTPQRCPLLERIETNAGHGGGKPIAKIIDEYTDILCFLVQTLGIKFQK